MEIEHVTLEVKCFSEKGLEPLGRLTQKGNLIYGNHNLGLKYGDKPLDLFTLENINNLKLPANVAGFGIERVVEYGNIGTYSSKITRKLVTLVISEEPQSIFTLEERKKRGENVDRFIEQCLRNGVDSFVYDMNWDTNERTISTLESSKIGYVSKNMLEHVLREIAYKSNIMRILKDVESKVNELPHEFENGYIK
jgi:hypothetical protein